MSETGKYNPELQAGIRKSVDGPVDLGRSDEGELEKDREYSSQELEKRTESWYDFLQNEWDRKLELLNGTDFSLRKELLDMNLDYTEGNNKEDKEFKNEVSNKIAQAIEISKDWEENVNEGALLELFVYVAEYRAKQEKSKLSLGKIFISTIINKPGAGHIERGSGEGIKKETYKRNAEFKRILEDKMLAYYKVEITDKSEMSKEDREIYDNMVRTSFDGHYRGYVIPSLGLSFTVSDLEGVGTYVINDMPDVSNIQDVSEFFSDTSKYPRRLIKWDKEKGMENWQENIEYVLDNSEQFFKDTNGIKDNFVEKRLDDSKEYNQRKEQIMKLLLSAYKKWLESDRKPGDVFNSTWIKNNVGRTIIFWLYRHYEGGNIKDFVEETSRYVLEYSEEYPWCIDLVKDFDYRETGKEKTNVSRIIVIIDAYKKWLSLDEKDRGSFSPTWLRDKKKGCTGGLLDRISHDYKENGGVLAFFKLADEYLTEHQDEYPNITGLYKNFDYQEKDPEEEKNIKNFLDMYKKWLSLDPKTRGRFNWSWINNNFSRTLYRRISRKYSDGFLKFKNRVVEYVQKNLESFGWAQNLDKDFKYDLSEKKKLNEQIIRFLTAYKLWLDVYKDRGIHFNPGFLRNKERSNVGGLMGWIGKEFKGKGEIMGFLDVVKEYVSNNLDEYSWCTNLDLDFDYDESIKIKK